MVQDNTPEQDLSPLIDFFRNRKQSDGLKPEVMDVRNWMDHPDEKFFGMAELSVRFGLIPEDIEILAFLAGMAIVAGESDSEPMTVEKVARILASDDLEKIRNYLDRFRHDRPLSTNALIWVDSAKCGESRLDRRLVDIPDKVLSFLRQPNHETESVAENLDRMAVRTLHPSSAEDARLPEITRKEILNLVRQQRFPALIIGADGSDRQEAAGAIAVLRNLHLLTVHLPALIAGNENVLGRRCAELFREAALERDLVYLDASDMEVDALHVQILNRCLSSKCLVIGCSELPHWLARLARNWPQICVPQPNVPQRIALWQAAFQDDRHAPSLQVIESIASRYSLSAPQIRTAASDAQQSRSAARRKKIDLSDLEHACLRVMPGETDSLTERILVPEISPQDLMLPEAERAKIDEILLYARAHDTIYTDWGFGEMISSGRSITALLYGLPGTGKSMASCLIARQLAFPLCRVDCARLRGTSPVETCDRISKIFDNAEREQNILRFDRIDLLFPRTGSADRLGVMHEMAYFAQRMAHFEGVVLLETSDESALDEDFKRQIKYRIYFPMPDAETRAVLYRNSIPESAPMKDGIPFDILADCFELTGGHIRNVVLNSAFYAYRDNARIGLSHLTEAAIRECRELGMLINDNLPMPLTNALRAEAGLAPLTDEEYRRIHRPVISQDLPLLDIPEGIPIGPAGEFDYR